MPQSFEGFVMRATCLNPRELMLDGCVDVTNVIVWDPDFDRLFFTPFEEVRSTSLNRDL